MSARTREVADSDALQHSAVMALWTSVVEAHTSQTITMRSFSSVIDAAFFLTRKQASNSAAFNGGGTKNEPASAFYHVEISSRFE